MLNGTRRELTIVGIALSPEYVYSIRPGDLLPDNRRFGILLDGAAKALAAAFDMEGGFNDIVARGSCPERLKKRSWSGSTGCSRPMAAWAPCPARSRPRHWYLQNELDQLMNVGNFLPWSSSPWRPFY